MIALFTPMLVVGGFSFVVLAAFAMQLRRARQNREVDWSELVFRLRPAERPALGKIASDYLDGNDSPTMPVAEAMLEQIGGLSGLSAIYQNSKVMLALAGYVTRWNFEEGTAVAERIRRDAVLLQKTILRIRVEIYAGRLLRRVPFRQPHLYQHLQKTALLYQQMSERLLNLYRENHAGLYPQLSLVLRIC